MFSVCDCSTRQVSLSPTRPRSSTQSPPRHLTPTATIMVPTAISAVEKKPRPMTQQQPQQQTADNPYAMKLQRETEALLRQVKPPQTSAAATTTKLRTFSCGSVCLSLCVCLSVCLFNSSHWLFNKSRALNGSPSESYGVSRYGITHCYLPCYPTLRYFTQP